MRRYRLFHAPVMSFFSLEFYRDVGLHWKGTGFGYLLLLLAICWIPLFVQFQIAVDGWIRDKAPAFVTQIPSIKITKGEASADVPQPYEIVDPDNGKVMAIIDTTGKTVSLEGTEARLLLTKTEVIYRERETETRTYELKGVEDFSLNQSVLNGWLNAFRRCAAILLFPIAAIGSFVLRIIQILLYAAIGLAFALKYKANPSYETLLRLSVMAVTPPIIANTIFGIAGVKIPWHGLVYFVAAMIYLFMAVKVTFRPDDRVGPTASPGGQQETGQQ